MHEERNAGEMRAMVVGAGIGGLTAAIALRRAGVETTVFERAGELREIGAGLLLAANVVGALETSHAAWRRRTPHDPDPEAGSVPGHRRRRGAGPVCARGRKVWGAVGAQEVRGPAPGACGLDRPPFPRVRARRPAREPDFVSAARRSTQGGSEPDPAPAIRAGDALQSKVRCSMTVAEVHLMHLEASRRLLVAEQGLKGMEE